MTCRSTPPHRGGSARRRESPPPRPPPGGDRSGHFCAAGSSPDSRGGSRSPSTSRRRRSVLRSGDRGWRPPGTTCPLPCLLHLAPSQPRVSPFPDVLVRQLDLGILGAPAIDEHGAAEDLHEVSARRFGDGGAHRAPI